MLVAGRNPLQSLDDDDDNAHYMRLLMKINSRPSDNKVPDILLDYKSINFDKESPIETFLLYNREIVGRGNKLVKVNDPKTSGI